MRGGNIISGQISGSKRRYYLSQYLFFFLGVFSTMPIVCLTLGGREFSIFTILLFFSFAILFIKSIRNSCIILTKGKKTFILWFVLCIVSCLVGAIWFMKDHPVFSEASLAYLPKIIIFLIFFILWDMQSKGTSNNEALVKGIIVGAIINLVWTIIDATGFYLFGKSINNIVFYSYAVRHGVHYNAISIIKNGTIRSSGFNFDPAHIGFLEPIIFGLGLKRKKISLIIIALLSIISSASTTALTCTLILLLLNINYKELSSRLTKDKILFGVSIIVLLVFLIVIGNRMIPIIKIATNNFWQRISNVYLVDHQENLRVRYLINAPIALLNLGLLALTGTGFGTASYGYVSDPYLLTIIGADGRRNIETAYDMENTYLAYLFDTGVIGSIVFFILLFGLQKRSRKQIDNGWLNIALYSFLTSTLLSMLFYHYILYAVQMLGIIVAVSYYNQNNNDIYNS